MGGGDQEDWEGREKGREIQTLENLHDFMLRVADFSFVVVAC